MPSLGILTCAWPSPASLLMGVLALGLGASVSGEPLHMRSIPVPPAVVALSTEELIDKLQEEAPGQPNAPWPALVNAFQPLDVSRGLGGYEPNPANEPRSPVMAELIGRGARAVPLLLRHLDDARPTRLVRFHPPGMLNDGGIWFDDLYFPRVPGTTFDPPVNHEVDFDSTRELKAGKSYTLKVGDLCFVALGQIVNRPLTVFGPVVKDGSGYIRSTSLNSPVESPALAQAARKDWRTLTLKEHEDQLVAEAWKPDSLGSQAGPSEGAIQRLLYFYPEDGQSVAVALLKRPLVDADVQLAVIQLQMEPVEEQLSEIKRFRARHSPELFEQLHFRLELAAARRGDQLAEALRLGFPEPGLLAAGPETSAPLYDQHMLLYALSPFDSPEVEDAVADLCDHASQWEGNTLGDRLGRDQLMLDCVKRLKGRPAFERCAPMLRSEMAALAADARTAKKDPQYKEAGSEANQFLAEKGPLKQFTEEAEKVLKGP